MRTLFPKASRRHLSNILHYEWTNPAAVAEGRSMAWEVLVSHDGNNQAAIQDVGCSTSCCNMVVVMLYFSRNHGCAADNCASGGSRRSYANFGLGRGEKIRVAHLVFQYQTTRLKRGWTDGFWNIIPGRFLFVKHSTEMYD